MSVQSKTLQDIAGAQYDLVTRAQCRNAGMSDRVMSGRVSSGRWVRVLEGVFLTKPGRSDWHMKAAAALLWAQSDSAAADAALCGRSAGFLWGLVPTAPNAIELVVPNQRVVVAPSEIHIRRSMRWGNLVHETALPWRTTVPATVLELASKGSDMDALAAVANAVQKELVTPTELRQEIVARGGHKFSRVLRPALAELDEGGQSGAEILYVRDVERAHGLPRATRQSHSDVGRRRYHDNEYEEYGLIVEVDGRLGHERWSDRVRDGKRDRQLLGAARVTTRVFWVDVAVLPCETAGEIGAILRSRGWSGAPRRCRRATCSIVGVRGSL